MKKLSVKKDSQCMACLECVRACSVAFYKEFDPAYSCIQIVAKGTGAKPNVCIQCGKCMKTCEHDAITQNPKSGVYMINKKNCVGCGKCVEVCTSPRIPFPSVSPAAFASRPAPWKCWKLWKSKICFLQDRRSQERRFFGGSAAGQ